MRAAMLTLAAAALLQGCSWFSASAKTTAMESLNVITFPAANDRMATAVDIVFVYRQEVVALLPQRAPEWFGRRNELLAGAPDGLDVVSYQLPPGQELAGVALPKRHRSAVRVVAYANHLESAGQVPVNLTPLRRAVLWIDRQGIGAMEQGEAMVPNAGE